jgi:hypothetical protein
MFAYMALSGLGAAVPFAIRTNDVAEIAIYQAVADRALRIKADAMKR